MKNYIIREKRIDEGYDPIEWKINPELKGYCKISKHGEWIGLAFFERETKRGWTLSTYLFNGRKTELFFDRQDFERIEIEA